MRSDWQAGILVAGTPLLGHSLLTIPVVGAGGSSTALRRLLNLKLFQLQTPHSSEGIRQQT